ncbi:MAG: phospho-sugar mutase, partial [Corallococcus sp.]|nr:phospho-sugar mutase [Corallococcus sp.]
TCPYPNPENNDALRLAVGLAKKSSADIVIATDPDCDRLGIAVRSNGEYVRIGGNEVGVILCDYVFSNMRAKGTLPIRPVVVKTIVTTTMVDALAAKYGAETRDVLTGFKYIGDVINRLESVGEGDRFVFGFEESCGYLKGSYARDKDGVVASMLIAECAAELKKKNKTLLDRLNELYDELGGYFQRTVSYRFDGVTGERRKNELLAGLRGKQIDKLGDSPVVSICDFLNQTELDLPKSNVLRYGSADGSRLIIRPSGTEPLVKCYAIVRGDASKLDKILSQTDKLFR